MPRYAITEKAGPFVAAHRNTGVGTVLDLSEHQAAHELRLGTLIELGTAPTVPIQLQKEDGGPVPEQLSADDVTAPDPARKARRSLS